MKKGHLKDLAHDILELVRWRSPLENVFVPSKYEIDLVSGKILGGEESDSLVEILRFKREWFLDRLEQLNGSPEDFEKARIVIFGAKEKVELKYNGKEIVREKFYDPESPDSENSEYHTKSF
jgi:hypothetical protein